MDDQTNGAHQNHYQHQQRWSGNGGNGGGGGGNRRRNQLPNQYRTGGRKRTIQQADIADDDKKLINHLLTGFHEIEVEELPGEIRKGAGEMITEIRLNSEQCLDTFFHAILVFPALPRVYASLLGLINRKETEFVTSLLATLSSKIQESLQNAQYVEFRLLLNFLSSLPAAHVVAVADVLAVLSQLLAVLQSSTSYSINTFVLECLIYACIFMGSQIGEHWLAVASTIESYVLARHGSSALQTLKVFMDSESEDRLANLWEAAKALQAAEWASPAIIDPTGDLSEDLEKSQLLSFTCLLPSFSSREPHAPIADLALVQQEEFKMPDIQRLLASQYILDNFYCFQPVHKTMLRMLFQSRLPFPIAHLILETCITSLLQVQYTTDELPLRMAYVAQIVADMFKERVNTTTSMPRVFGSIMNYLWQRSAVIHPELRDRLAQYFAFHLSNFAFTWPWTAWQIVIEDENGETEQRLFVRGILDRLVRLSYWDRIASLLPEEFVKLMPHQPTPAFRFSEKNAAMLPDGATWLEFGSGLMQLLKARADPPTVLTWLNDVVGTRLGPDARLRLFMPCLLEHGNKSYSHVIALLERFQSEITQLSADDQLAERVIVHCVAEYWQHSNQHQLVILHKLQELRLIRSTAVLAFVFQRFPMQQNAAHLWALVYTTAFVTVQQRKLHDTEDIESVPFVSIDGINSDAIKAAKNSAEQKTDTDKADLESSVSVDVEMSHVTPVANGSSSNDQFELEADLVFTLLSQARQAFARCLAESLSLTTLQKRMQHALIVLRATLRRQSDTIAQLFESDPVTLEDEASQLGIDVEHMHAGGALVQELLSSALSL